MLCGGLSFALSLSICLPVEHWEAGLQENALLQAEWASWPCCPLAPTRSPAQPAAHSRILANSWMQRFDPGSSNPRGGSFTSCIWWRTYKKEYCSQAIRAISKFPLTELAKNGVGAKKTKGQATWGQEGVLSLAAGPLQSDSWQDVGQVCSLSNFFDFCWALTT